MALENITKILTDNSSREELIKLIDNQHALNLAMQVHKEEKERIAQEYKKLGLSATEFNKFTKMLKDEGDLLNYERGLLEIIDQLKLFMDK